MRVCNMDAVFLIRSMLVWEVGKEGKRSDTWVDGFSSPPLLILLPIG